MDIGTALKSRNFWIIRSGQWIVFWFENQANNQLCLRMEIHFFKKIKNKLQLGSTGYFRIVGM